MRNNLRREFFAQAGQRVRVALTWWAIADASPYTNVVLDTDLDLWIKSPANRLLTASISDDNNYELVDFNAPETGIYSLLVVASGGRPADAPPNYFGIAVATTRYSVYLPAILR